MIYPAIDNRASSEIRADIRFLHVKTWVLRKSIVNYTRGDLRLQCNEWRNCKTVVLKCSKEDEQMIAMKSEVVGSLYCVMIDLVQNLGQEICERRHFKTFVWISTNFTHFTLWDYHGDARQSQVSRKMASENGHGCAQNAENGFGFLTFSSCLMSRLYGRDTIVHSSEHYFQ
jgi:hypothetical protein